MSGRRSASTSGANNTKGAKLPPLPKKPEAYTLGDAAEDLSELPIWVRGTHTKKLEDGSTDYESDGQCAFLCKPLTMHDTLQYRRIYGETPEQTIARIHWVFALEHNIYNEIQEIEQKLAKGEIKPEEVVFKYQHVYADDDKQVLKTPHGNQHSMPEDIAQVICYVLSIGGRIEAELADGSYVVNHDYSPDDIQKEMRPSAIENAVQGSADGQLPLWHVIIETAQLWKARGIEEALEKDGEKVVSKESKNSLESNNGDS